MISKSFKEMMDLDLSNYIKKRDGIEYLPWADCIYLLHENGAEIVMFEPLVDPNTNSSLFKTDREFVDKDGKSNCCYEVAVKITIDNDVFVMRTPVMNGTNPVKDGFMSQQRVWTAQARAFVKGVAMKTGLGFKLWIKGDVDAEYTEDLNRHSIMKIKERMQEEYTDLLVKGLSTDDIAKRLEMSPDEVKMYFAYCDMIEKFEQKLTKIKIK